MTATAVKLLIYLSPLALIWPLYFRRQARTTRANLGRRQAAEDAGLAEPASLHPVIDAALCIGCGACVNACPEQNVLGLIDKRAALINPSHCIGHGACKAACPADAITLVFGTEKRGVDIPTVSPAFETNVPGIFIAGELGGMGLIRNAVEQGRQALESIRKIRGAARDGMLDVFIVGAGPAGLSASLAAMQHGMRHVTVEQDSLGGTVAHFPRGKIVMTAPMHIPLVGKIKLSETTKETLLELWQDIERRTELRINYKERLEQVVTVEGGFEITTTRDTYRARSILLAIGRRGTPRKLGVPGEDLPKVVYRLIDPAQYRDQQVLVVGGGDAALEAAVSIAAEPGTRVTLSYRSEAFSRAKEKNRKQVAEAEARGTLTVLMKSNVTEISPEGVRLEQEGSEIELANDAVVVCAGGILPTPFLKGLGIAVETKYGTA